MWNVLKKLRQIASHYDKSCSSVERVDKALFYLSEMIRERTTIGVDVDIEGNHGGRHQVVVVGRYGNTDYVQTYSRHADDMRELIDRLKGMQRAGVVRAIDAPPEMRAVIRTELVKDGISGFRGDIQLIDDPMRL